MRLDDFSGQLARESGRLLGELGVRPEDTRWIHAHAETIASLSGSRETRPPLYDVFRRWARRAARAAR